MSFLAARRLAWQEKHSYCRSRKCKVPGMDEVPRTAKPVFGVILAAGRSRRFGGTKLLADLGGRPLVLHAAAAAFDAFGENTLLVTGHDSVRVAAAARGSCGAIVDNPRYDDGLGTSLALAVSTLRDRAGAVVVLLADQPFVPAAHLRELANTWNGRADEIVATRYGETEGVPAGLYPMLEALDGDAGARRLFTDPRFRVRRVPLASASIDVDTADDLATAKQRLADQA